MGIQPIENLTECSTVNGEIFGYEGFVEVNVQIPGEIFLKIICFWLLLKLAIRGNTSCTWDLLH